MVIKGIVPAWTLDIALTSPIAFQVPLAPSEGMSLLVPSLSLLSSSVQKKCTGQSTST